jgi:antitoxin ParD1/3/4
MELSKELEQLVRDRVESGRYTSASDVLEDALALLEEQELYLSAQRDTIQARIAEGYASLRAGDGVDGEAVFERIERELTAELV